MTQKEKAKELVHLFLTAGHGTIEEYIPIPNLFAKICASIVVDEIIKSNPTNPITSRYIELYSDMIDESIDYWQEVKQEIINLEI